MNKDLWNQFLGGKIGVRCDTREQHDQLMAECEKAGLGWHSDVKATQHDSFESGRTYIKDCGRLMYCSNTSCSHGGEIPNYCNAPCVHRNTLPFSAIFPADPWAEFVAGKCYLRVTKEERAEFAKRCEAAGLRRYNVPGVYSLAKMGGWYWPDGVRRFAHQNTSQGLCVIEHGSDDMPIHPFSPLLPQPEPAPKAPEQPAPKLKAGDTVRFVKKTGNESHSTCAVIGKTYKVVGFSDRGNVRLNIPSCPYVNPEDVEIVTGKPAPSRKIVITTDGRVTTATLYEGGKAVKKGEAKCDPRDVFDFKRGADIAYGRLMQKTNGGALEITVNCDMSAAMDAVQEVHSALDKLVARIGKLATP